MLVGMYVACYCLILEHLPASGRAVVHVLAWRTLLSNEIASLALTPRFKRPLLRQVGRAVYASIGRCRLSRLELSAASAYPLFDGLLPTTLRDLTLRRLPLRCVVW